MQRDLLTRSPLLSSLPALVCNWFVSLTVTELSLHCLRLGRRPISCDIRRWSRGIVAFAAHEIRSYHLEGAL